jgi:hypothetical protein
VRLTAVALLLAGLFAGADARADEILSRLPARERALVVRDKQN